jgi:hypothetical protein
MTTEDMMIGCYYRVDTGNKWIIKITRLTAETVFGDCLQSKNLFLDTNFCQRKSSHKVFDASPKEKARLDACIRQGKYVDEHEIEAVVDNFQIY